MLQGTPWLVRFSPLLPIALSIAFVFAGCGKKADALADQNAKLFQSADPQLKADWEAASAAIKTNGFAPAILTLKRMQDSGKLSPDQLKAVNETVTAANDQMYAAANKGDASANQQIKELRKALAR